MVLFFGIATATFGFSILEDAYTKFIKLIVDKNVKTKFLKPLSPRIKEPVIPLSF